MTWTPTSQYWVGSRPMASRRLTTSPTELVHLLVAFAVLTFDLAVVGSQLALRQLASLSVPALVDAAGFGAAAALTGFVAHEMAHKIVAQRYGFWAEFRMSPMGLLLSVMTSLFGVIWAAPGATVVGGMGDVREWGRTSLAGPALNLAEGSAFLGLALLLGPTTSLAPAASFLALLAFINGWFAAFNLIPLGPLDGRKVFRWSPGVWGAALAVAVVFLVGVFWLQLGFP